MERKKNHFYRGLIITLAVFAVLFAGSNLLINRVDSGASEAEKELVRDAVRSAVLTCYAVEGAYPPELDYLKTHYGLIFDEERYMVIYDSFASNIMPDISVLEVGGAQ